MDKNEAYERNTSSLKNLFKKADNSGKIAWNIGDLLLNTYKEKLYKVKYKSFEKFTEKEFDKTAQTAMTYISIRERFKLTDISNNMLVTHLKAIADFENSYVGDIVLKALDKVITGSNPKKGEPIPSTNDIDLSLNLLSEAGELDEKQAVQTLVEVAKESKKASSKKKKKKTKVQRFGKRLVSKGISKIAEIFENEPIDEMGTVALFCILFPFIKGKTFKLNNETLAFESIKYVRTPFPDSSLRVKETIRGKSTYKEIQVEFEFESYNFIKHKHFEDKLFKDCKLIICWVDNMVGKKTIPSGLKKKLPEVIELSNILKTGEIKIKNVYKVEKEELNQQLKKAIGQMKLELES